MLNNVFMRSVLSISLSEEEKKRIAERAKKAGTTVSEYILYALDLEDNLISEDEVLAMAKRAEKAYKEGKTKRLNSLADLI